MVDTDNNQAVRILVWIVPRVHSTILLKCMSFVEDTEVWMEPYMTSFLKRTVLNPEHMKDHPIAQRNRAKWHQSTQSQDAKEYADSRVAEDTEHSMAMTAKYPNLSPHAAFTDSWVKKQLETEQDGKKFIFVKDQSFAVFDQLDKLPKDVPTKHAFLIRHPAEVYTSWKDIAVAYNDPINPIPWDECNVAEEFIFLPIPELYQIHHKLWKHVKEHLDPDAFIIDGHDLTGKPEVILPKMFEKLGIPYKPSYLEWPADPELVYSSWRGAHEVVVGQCGTEGLSRALASTNFEPPRRARGVTKPEWPINDELKGYIDAAMPLYEEMYANRLV